MKIERIFIDGFGHFEASEFGPLEHGLVIFHGPNESGKTTLHSFIQTILFGFPRSNSVDWIPALAGGKHGGRIVLRDCRGERFTIERHASSAGREAHIYRQGDPAWNGVSPGDLLGGLTSDVYSSVFAIELDDLQSLDSLPDEEVSGRIYGAGLGAERLPDVLADFEKQAGNIYLERGRVQPVAKLLKSLDALDARLDAVRAEAETYHGLNRKCDEINQQICELDNALKSRREVRDRYRGWVADLEHHQRACLARDQALDRALDDYGFGRETLTAASPERLKPVRQSALEYRRRLSELVNTIEAVRRDVQHQEAELSMSSARLEQLERQLSVSNAPASADLTQRREHIVAARLAWSKVQMAEQVLANMQQLMPASNPTTETVFPIALLLSSLVLAFVGLISGGMVLILAGLLAAGLFAAATYFYVAGRHNERQNGDSFSQLQRDAAENRAAFKRAAQALGIDPARGQHALAVAESELETFQENEQLTRQHREARSEVDRRHIIHDDHLANLRMLDHKHDDLWRAWADQIGELGHDRQSSPDDVLQQIQQLESLHQLDKAYKSARQDTALVIEQIQNQRNRSGETLETADLERACDAIENQLQDLEDQRTAALQQRGDLNNELRRLETETSGLELRAQREEARSKLRELAREWSVFTIAHSLLDRARRQYEDERRPGVARTASDVFSTITGGAYDRVIFPLDSQTDVFVESSNGNRKPVAALSRGAREQVYLSLRIGLIREFGRQSQPMPVLLDDILVNFDPARACATAHALADLAPHHQILLFTCHPQTVALLRSVMPQAQVVALE